MPPKKAAKSWVVPEPAAAKPDAAADKKPGQAKPAEKWDPVNWTDDGHIATYNPGKLFLYGYIYYLRGTVFVSVRIMTSVVMYCIFSQLYALGVCNGNQTAPNGDVCGQTTASQTWCSSKYGNICFFTISIQDGLYLAGLASFLMGIFMQQTLTRWWSTREKLQVVIGQGNNLAILISTYIAGEDDEAKGLRSDLLRYINLAHGLLYLQAAGSSNYNALVARGLLTEDEKIILNATGFPQKFLLVYHWAAQLLVRVGATGRVTFPCNMLPVIQGGLSALRGNAADIFMFLTCQIPYAYAHLLTIIVKFHLFMVVIVSGSTMGQGIISGNNSAIVWGYALMTINTIVFEGLLEMHAKIVNPFLSDPDDFPAKAYLDNCVKATSSVLLAANDANLPSAVRDRVLSPVPFTCCTNHPLNVPTMLS